ncbi:MAG: N-6 DNA methylase [Nitrososphaerales archaeon]
MLKRLYQYLVPKKIRHDLGEYYTPDWLAELVLNEVDYKGDLDKRLLDPACGSGTFLVLAIKRAKEYAHEHFIHESDTLKKILKNIIGFDLNPLAVLAARTNYLIALGDLIRYRGIDGIEIPIYLADSILVERRGTLAGTAYVLRTSVGEFMIPSGIIDRGILASVLSIVEECVKVSCNQEEFIVRLLREISIDDAEVSILTKLYTILLKLEKEEKNRIWIRVLKNSFAPLFTGQFDYVIGNPPWVAWENLPTGYRERIRPLFQHYRLIPGKLQARVKMDLSMLFSYVGMDRYLKEGGIFGFLITQTVFVSIAGEGFRRLVLPDGTQVGVIKIHDMVDLLPFEGAQNRTGIFIAEKGKRTIFPIPYIKWRK